MTIDGVIRRVLFVVCLMLAPAILLAIELFHPANFTAHPGMYQFLSHAEHGGAQFKALAYFGPDWWFTLHMIQTPWSARCDRAVAAGRQSQRDG